MATQRFLREEILTRFQDSELARLEDGAAIELGGTCAVLTTDTYIVDPPLFPGGDIGRLAIAGTVNDLVASGARPRFGSLGLVLTEGFPLADLRRVLDSAAEVARLAGLRLVTGDTKVLPKNVGPGISLNVTGVGEPVRPGQSYNLAQARAGDAIIVTGTLGDHGLAVLSQREGLGFERRVHSDCAPLHELVLPILESNAGVHALRDPTRGGVAGVLHDLVDAAGLNVHIDDAALPVQEEVRAGCAMLGLDPMDVINEGKMILVVDPREADQVLSQLRAHALGERAAVIGRVAAPSKPARLTLHGAGREEILLRREAASIPRLC